MSYKIFIIDDQADYRALLGHHVSTHWPSADVKLYDPIQSGRLPDAFSGAGSDIVLLGHPAGECDGLDWLRQFCQVAQFPPIVFIGDGDERQIVSAIKAGAGDYISKQKLNHARLIEVMESLLDQGRPHSTTGVFELDPDDPVGKVPANLKGFEFQRRLVVNDISAVYLARQQSTGEMMVLKILRQVPDSGNEAIFDRFLQEYELVAKLDHPSIVKIFDLGVTDDHAFIAMEYCSKGSLKRRINRGLSPQQAFGFMREIADALGELHRAGIMHRDLKPTNVMFREDDRLVLIDFGLAKQAKLSAEITGTGEIFGTPYYMSPEQGHAADVDERADIYSLGVIFYEMLTGHKPFVGETAMAVIVKHKQEPIPRLPDELAVFQPAIDRMMAKDPDDRFQTIEELLDWAPVEKGVALSS